MNSVPAPPPPKNEPLDDVLILGIRIMTALLEMLESSENNNRDLFER